MQAGDALLLGLAALVPVAFLALTSYVKISMVLTLVRSAFGTPEAPSALVVMGISLLLSAVAMAPVLQDMASAAATALHPEAAGQAPPASRPAPGAAAPAPTSPRAEEPSWRALVPAAQQGQVSAVLAAMEPLRKFALAHSAARELSTFASLARERDPSASAQGLSVVVPAFIASELARAFAMAIVLLLPFLVIDLVVSLVLAALGTTTLSPQVVALPLKLLLFLAVDGWRLLLEALLRAYV